LGFECSSDHVSTHISYAVVFAEAPTREAIVDAFKKTPQLRSDGQHPFGRHLRRPLDGRRVYSQEATDP